MWFNWLIKLIICPWSHHTQLSWTRLQRFHTFYCFIPSLYLSKEGGLIEHLALFLLCITLIKFTPGNWPVWPLSATAGRLWAPQGSTRGSGGWFHFRGEKANINFPCTAFPRCSEEVTQDSLPQSCLERELVLAPSEDSTETLSVASFRTICNIFHFLWQHLEFINILQIWFKWLIISL